MTTWIEAMREAITRAEKKGILDAKLVAAKWDKYQCYWCEKGHEALTRPPPVPVCREHLDKLGELRKSLDKLMPPWHANKRERREFFDL